jgi:hypothetical protein
VYPCSARIIPCHSIPAGGSHTRAGNAVPSATTNFWFGGIGASYGASGSGAVNTSSAEQADKLKRQKTKTAVLF